jgi:rhodanese-related sulfurtransferase
VTDILTRAVKEAIVIAIVVVVVAFVVNFSRDGGVPLIADADSFRIQTDAEFLVAADAAAHFNDGTAMFLDAREPGLFRIEHVEGAENLPSNAAEVGELAWLIPADPVLICYSSAETERQAGVIADKLLEMGFTKVYVLHGGLESWVELRLPTATGD